MHRCNSIILVLALLFTSNASLSNTAVINITNKDCVTLGFFTNHKHISLVFDANMESCYHDGYGQGGEYVGIGKKFIYKINQGNTKSIIVTEFSASGKKCKYSIGAKLTPFNLDVRAGESVYCYVPDTSLLYIYDCRCATYKK